MPTGKKPVLGGGELRKMRQNLEVRGVYGYHICHHYHPFHSESDWLAFDWFFFGFFSRKGRNFSLFKGCHGDSMQLS